MIFTVPAAAPYGTLLQSTLRMEAHKHKALTAKPIQNFLSLSTKIQEKVMSAEC